MEEREISDELKTIQGHVVLRIQGRELAISMLQLDRDSDDMAKLKALRELERKLGGAIACAKEAV